MDASTKDDSPSIKVKPLDGNLDYLHWRRNARASLVRQDHLLLGLEPAPLGNSAAQQSEWNKASAIAKGSITLMLSQAVKVRAIGYCDDPPKTAHELWQFLESMYTESNERAIHNLRNKLNSLVYVEETECYGHMNQFNNIIGQLALQNINITEAEKKSLIRSLPKSMSVISIVVSATPNMKFDAIDALVREEIEREKNPNNRKGNTKTQTSANTAQRVQQNSNRHDRCGNFLDSNNLKYNNLVGEEGVCYYCGKPGHFKRVCHKKIADDKRRQNNSVNHHNNYQCNKSWQNQIQRSSNSTQNNWNCNDQNISKSDVQALTSAVQSLMNNSSINNQNQFGGFMAQVKFRSNIAELSETKNPNAYIESGTTHHFFYRRSSFSTYEAIKEEKVQGANAT